MQFLRTLFWVLLAVLIVLFARGNWFDVTLNLWGDLQADIKVPVLLALAFLLGFLPTFILYRARLWTIRRRLEAQDRQPSTSSQPAPAGQPAVTDDSPVI